jgi:hypothetical protein
MHFFAKCLAFSRKNYYIIRMRPQFYPWLFDDKNAWEKSLADPRYSYELPMDFFMSLYTMERKVNPGEQSAYAIPLMPAMPAMPVTAVANAAAVFSTPLSSSSSVISAPAPAPKEEKKEEGILSQDEIDALLSGL